MNISDAMHGRIKKFLTWMNNNIQYGKLVEGTVYTNTYDFSDYRTISPENFKRFKVGVCWDYVEYEAQYFKNEFRMKQVTTVPKHMEFALYFCQFKDLKKNMPTHTWLVYNLNGRLYTFESSWYDYRGIRSFSSEKEMLDNYLNAQREFHKKQKNPVSNPVVYRYDSHTIYNLDPDTYMRGIYRDGKKVTVEAFDAQMESFRIEDITDKSIKKYDYPGLKHLRIDGSHKGKIMIDSTDNNVVGFININTDRKDIQALEINKEYRRSGYATKLLDVAKSMGAKTLWVRDTNIDAQKLYAKTGWKKTGKTQGRMIEMSCESFESKMESFMIEHGVKPDSHDAMNIICENMFDDKDKRITNKYAMEPITEALLDKSDALQNIVFSGKDLYCNYDKFGKEYNVCFVIGYSGSGKSVLADKLAKKHKAIHIDLDIFTFFAMRHSFDDPEIAGYAGGILTKYIKEMNKPLDLFLGKKIRTDMQFVMKETNEFVRWLVSRKSKKELFIVDGVQCSWVLSSNPEYNTYPVIFKGTSLLTSTLRAAKRSGQALSIPYIINGLTERYSGRSLIEYPKQFILPNASSIEYKDESAEPTTEGVLDKRDMYEGYKSSGKIDNMVIERSENMETNKQPTEQDKRRAIQKALSIVKKIIAKLPADYRGCFEQRHDLAEMKEFLSGESHRIELYRWTVYPYANKVKESPRTSDFLDKFGRECLNPCYDMLDKEKDSIPGFTFDYSGDWDEGSIELELKNPPPVVKKPKPKAKRVTKPSKKVDSKLLALWRSL